MTAARGYSILKRSMQPRVARRAYGIRGLALASLLLHLLLASSSWAPASADPLLRPAPRLTSAANGPLHVEGDRIVDASGAVFLTRGTQLPEFPFHQPSPAPRFGPYSATTLSTIRLRWNMNTVCLPVNVAACHDDSSCWPELARVVRRAHEFELTVILAAREPRTDLPPLRIAEFWRRYAAAFKDDSNVMFEVSGDAKPAVRAIRSTGAAQPIIVDASFESPLRDPNLIYRLDLPDAALTSGPEHFAYPKQRSPLLVNLRDLPLDRDADDCRAVPADPSIVEQRIEAFLREFDMRAISWMASVYAPGKLVTDYAYQDATTLENGWTCGAPRHPQAGMGQVVQFHLWNGPIRGVFATNQAGSFLLPRGAVATLYGAIFADRDSRAGGGPLPVHLAGIGVQVTDGSGNQRWAGLRWVSAGWGQIDFVVPEESAAGPARLTIVRADGTNTPIQATLVDVAPALVTDTQNTHGFASGEIIQTLPGGRRRLTPTYRCNAAGCRPAPIVISRSRPTLLRLRGSGFHHARSISEVAVKIDGISVPVVSVAPGGEAGVDFVTVRLPLGLRERGETEVIASVRGRLSNVALLQFGLRERSVATPYQWNLPPGFPAPRVPPGNPMTVEKVELGRHLFYDKRLSTNSSESCATCHRQELAFTDGRPAALGATGQPHPRSAMSLVNVAYSAALTWSNPGLRSLEQQALIPMFSETPVELGLHRSGEFLDLLRADPRYRELFPRAFPGPLDPFTITNVTKAIAAFERTIVSGRSPYDRYRYGGEPDAISDSAKRGEFLFFTDRVGACFRCHGGFNFSDAVDYQGQEPRIVPFHNTGLYNLPGLLSYPPPNFGIYSHTGRSADIGKFKAPSLRNIALTAPYMHDGSIVTLDGVLDHYGAGGRAPNPNKDKLLQRLSLSPQNREDLLAFLHSLTDDELIRDPRFSNPW